jgi:hypothetical protein
MSMARVVGTFVNRVVGSGNRTYSARACGRQQPSGLWEGWLEFVPDRGPAVRSGRDTTQPNLTDLEYWATGLTSVYLDGALKRALAGPIRVVSPAAMETPAFDGPAPAWLPASAEPPAFHAVLDPFSVYAKGDDLLRQELSAMSPWHLRNIIRAYALASHPSIALETLTAAELIGVIMSGVRARSADDTKASSRESPPSSSPGGRSG